MFDLVEHRSLRIRIAYLIIRTHSELVRVSAMSQQISTDEQSQSIREQVFKICYQLHSQSIKPKIRTVLDLLPSVSSTSTIHKYHKEWQEELRASKDKLFESFGFSTQFQDAFLTEINRFHSEAKNEYAEKITELTEGRDAAIGNLEAIEHERNVQKTLADKRESEIKELQAEIHNLTRDFKNQLVQQENSKQSAIEKLQHQLQEQEYRLNNEKVLVVEQLQQQISVLNSNNKELQGVCENQRTELAKAQLKNESNAELVSDIKERIKEIEEQAKERVAKLESDLAALSKDFQRESQNLAVANEKIAAKEEMFAVTVKQYEALSKNEENMRSMLVEANKTNKDLLIQLERSETDEQIAQNEVRRLSETLGEMKNIIKSKDLMIEKLEKSLQKNQN